MALAHCGVYQIVNTVNNKRYIGSSVSMARRWTSHQSGLRRNGHGNSHLQRSYLKYGEDAFVFEVLMYTTRAQLAEVEQLLINALCPEYNISTNTSATMMGQKHTDEAIEKIRQASIDMWANMSDTERQKRIGQIGAPFTGQSHTEESNEKNRQSHLGTSWGQHTEEARIKIRNSNNPGVMNIGPHTRWHTNRSIEAEWCKYCREGK